MSHRIRPRPLLLLTDRSATSAVEFAIIAPVFIMVFLGMVAYGVYFGASHSIQQLAADAARTAIAGLDETERTTLATAFITNNAADYAFVDTARLELDVADSAVDPNQFVVTVRYDASDLPIWSLLPEPALPTSTISRSSTIRIGGL